MQEFFTNMKRVLLFFALILTFINLCASAQINPYQDLNGMIWLKDGRNLQGIIRLGDLYKQVFVKTPDALELIFSASHIDSVHVSIPGEDSVYVIQGGKFAGHFMLALKLHSTSYYNLFERVEVQTYSIHEYHSGTASMQEVQKQVLKSEFYLQSLSGLWQKVPMMTRQWPYLFKGKEMQAKQILAKSSAKLTDKECLVNLVNEMNKFTAGSADKN